MSWRVARDRGRASRKTARAWQTLTHPESSRLKFSGAGAGEERAAASTDCDIRGRAGCELNELLHGFAGLSNLA